MSARHYYVIIDAVNDCIVMVRPNDNTVEVLKTEQAAAVAEILMDDGTEAGDEARQSLEGLSPAALAARLCSVPVDKIEDIVAASASDTEHVANGVCIAVGVDGGASVTFRADR